MTKIFIVLFYVLCIYLAIVCLAFFFQRSLLYFPTKDKIDISYYSQTGLKEVKFNTTDGLVLKSLFKKPISKDKQTLLIFHGNAGHVGHRVEKFKPFIDSGFGIFLLEYRGYGGNQGTPSEYGLYKDGLAALDFLSKQNITPLNTILYGESLGCGIATKLSTKHYFYATILEAPYTSISDVAQSHYWLLPAKWLVLDSYNILNIIHEIKSKLLIIHGEKDKIIDIKFSKKLFDHAPKPKEALYIPDAGHNNLYEFGIQKYILKFLSD